MSVETEADRLIDKAKENVQAAITALAEIVINECDGHDSFDPDFAKGLKLAMDDLITIRRRLRGRD